MMMVQRLFAGMCLALALTSVQPVKAFAFDGVSVPAAQQVLVPFSSEEGLARLSRANVKLGFPALANQFEAQSNAVFCGPTSAAIVLNAIFGRSPDLPHDRRRLSAADFQYLPKDFDLTLARFTQDNVITKGKKTRSQVLGEPMMVNGQQIQDFGYQIRQLDEMLKANGAKTHYTIVDDKKPEREIRFELLEALRHQGRYVIVGYKRSAVGQQGGGHLSPLGAYDALSDSFLVMDVNPARESWVWMPTATLVKGMRTFDTVENRGYIVVQAP